MEKTTCIPELVVLKLLLNIDIYNKYIIYINKDILKDKYKEIYMLYACLEDMHNKLKNKEKTLEEFRLWFFNSYPAMRSGDKEAFGTIFETLASAAVSAETLDALLKSIADRAKASRLSAVAFQVGEGILPPEKLSEAIVELSTGIEEPKMEVEWVSQDADVLMNSTIRLPGARWPLRSLNVSMGSLRPGNFGFVFARPETGKTTFLAHVSTHMAKDLMAKGLGGLIWFNNEQVDEEVQTRLLQAAFGVTAMQIKANSKKYTEEFKSFGTHLRMPRKTVPLHYRFVERLVRQEKPKGIIIDQIDKVRGFDADRPDLVYGRIYQWARELAKTEGCFVIGVCQASGEAEGQRWLTMDHVAEAKTSKQGEADFIIGIGKTNDDNDQNVRFINISKNKLMGDEDSDSQLRHGRFNVYIRPEIARYEDIDLG